MEKVGAKHILVKALFEAQDLQRKLEEGVSFEELAQKYSSCPSRASGGDLGEFGKGRMVEAFEDAAFSLNVGEVSKPIRTPFGYHLIKRYR